MVNLGFMRRLLDWINEISVSTRERQGKKNDSEGIRSENKTATLDWGPLTSFSQVLMQISDQMEGNQAPGARGVITACVFLSQSSLELGAQLPGELLPFQFSARTQSTNKSFAGKQGRRHFCLTL